MNNQTFYSVAAMYCDTYANGGNVAFSVGVIRESQQKTGLSNTGVTDKQKLLSGRQASQQAVPRGLD